MTEPVTPQQLIDASEDARDLADVVNGAVDLNGTGLVPTRTGGDKKTLAKLQAEFEAVIAAQEVQEEAATAAATTATTAATTATEKAEEAAELLASTLKSATRFGSLQFHEDNGFFNDAARATDLRSDGMIAALQTFGDARFWDGPSSMFFMIEFEDEREDGMNMAPVLMAANSGVTSRFMRVSTATEYTGGASGRRSISFGVRGESAPSAAWNIRAANRPLDSRGPYGVLIFNDGTNGYIHLFEVANRAWLDGAAAPKPAGFIGCGFFTAGAAGPFTIGNIPGSASFPPVGTSTFSLPNFRGAMSDILFANVALTKADIEAIIDGADPVAVATTRGATKHIYMPLVSGGQVDLSIQTTEAGLGAGLTLNGVARPGPDMRAQATSDYITLDRVPTFLAIPPKWGHAPVQLKGRTDMATPPDQFRLAARDGRALTSWIDFTASLSAGAWQGWAFVPPVGFERVELQTRNRRNPAVIASSHPNILIGDAVDFFAQSEGVIATGSVATQIPTSTALNVQLEGNTDAILFGHIQRSASNQSNQVIATVAASYKGRPGRFGDAATVVMNILAARAPRPVLLRLHTLSGTSMLSLMNDAANSRKWSEVDQLNAAATNRGMRGETITAGVVIFGWEAFYPGSFNVMAGAYRPFLTGVASGAVTNSEGIAQADLDHWLGDGTYSDGFAVVVVPNGRATLGLGSAGVSDLDGEANQRDQFRNYAHILGFRIGPEPLSHKMEGENAAGALPNSPQQHPEANDFEGNLEAAVIAAEAVLMAVGASDYAPALFERIRIGSDNTKVIVSLGEPREYPGLGLAEGATGYSTAAQIAKRATHRLHTKKVGGDPGACFEARRKPAGGSWGATLKLNIVPGGSSIINPKEVELQTVWTLAPGDEVEVFHKPGTPGSYSTATITQAAWRAGSLYLDGGAFDGDPTSYQQIANLGFAVAGSNQALRLVVT